MISVIIPFHNEKENLRILISQLIDTLKKIKEAYEVILVDDGSTDNFQFSVFNFQSNIKLLKHKKRLGKGQALKTGIENSSGDIIVFMDGDLQDDPKDLPKLLKKINEGNDFVNGKRVNRRENGLVKTYSKIASWFLHRFLNSPFTDINCGYKVFKKEILKDFNFYGNNFRFFPLAIYLKGYKVSEIPVVNNQRKFGKTKFGKSKIFIGILDMVTAYFLFKFAEKPLHFFGILGLIFFTIGSVILAYLGIERIFYHILLYRRPILFLGMLFVIVGIQIIMTGIIGELIVFLHKKGNNE